MNVTEAAKILSKNYYSADEGKKVVQIHLFGIKYADLLENISLPDLLKQARISHSYKVELRKAMNLAPFVRVLN